MSLKQIGISKVKDVKSSKPRALKYSDISHSNDWVDSTICLPFPYDLMELQITGKGKNLHGWWDGEKWEGLRIKPDLHIQKWKRVMHYE